MSKVTMYTVVPVTLAKQLATEKRIKDYNTLPQLNPVLLKLVKEYMVDNVGYPNLPIACLRSVKSRGAVTNSDVLDILSIIPANSNTSVLFQLEMPDDMVVSVRFIELLDASEEAGKLDLSDELDIDYLREKLEEMLHVGCESMEDDMICFIPFLDSSKCTFYSQFDSEFNTVDLQLPGIRQMDIKELTSFFN